jgi:hypothetical protein
LIRWPVKINSLALPLPTRRGRRWVPPAPGMMARRVSVSPMVRVMRGDADVRSQGQFRPTAQGNAVDRGNDRFVEILDGGKEIANGIDERLDLDRRQGGALLQVCAGAEGPVPGPGDDNHPHTGIEADVASMASQVLQQYRN